MTARPIVGAAVALAIALTARRTGSLSRGGAAAATVVGTICVTAGWDWAALLIAFFVASSALSRWREERKAARTHGIVAKGNERDAWQVLANGGLFAAAALASMAAPSPFWRAVGAGALAASTADTWATEVGTLAGGEPRSILTGRRLPVGASGGISLAGTMASLAGAALLAALVLFVGWSRATAWGALAGGIAGALADSALGATLQERRRCPACDAFTERLVHPCGTRTAVAGGIPRFRNDAVNLAASAVGAALAVAVAGAAGVDGR